jgi:ABC-type lipoprotein release transport system permease subunit
MMSQTLNTLLLGIRSLLMHKLRSLLTMLGVILGVGSVIAMLAIGEGSKREALEQLRQLGASNVIIRSVKPGQNDTGERWKRRCQRSVRPSRFRSSEKTRSIAVGGSRTLAFWEPVRST